ncbi:efflux RND transporter permease subunit, partial [Staphylococcus aureus]
RAADAIWADQAVDYVMSNVGALGQSATLNNGRLFIALKPKAERKEGVLQVIGRLRRTVSGIAGLNVYFVPVQNISIGGRASKSEFQYTL